MLRLTRQFAELFAPEVMMATVALGPGGEQLWYRLSSGRSFRGVLGIATNGTVYLAADSGTKLPDPPLSPAEQRELGTMMVDRWQRFAAVPPEVVEMEKQFALVKRVMTWLQAATWWKDWLKLVWAMAALITVGFGLGLAWGACRAGVRLWGP